MKKEFEKDISRFFQTYGDQIYDFCQSLVTDPNTCQLLFREIIQKIRSRRKSEVYQNYERSWVFKITCETLIEQQAYFKKEPSPEERIQLDSQASEAKLEKFEVYFHRLDLVDQMILLLKDKFDLPYSEISSALAIPEGSLKITRQQALRTLEEWLWNTK